MMFRSSPQTSSQGARQHHTSPFPRSSSSTLGHLDHITNNNDNNHHRRFASTVTHASSSSSFSPQQLQQQHHHQHQFSSTHNRISSTVSTLAPSSYSSHINSNQSSNHRRQHNFSSGSNGKLNDSSPLIDNNNKNPSFGSNNNMNLFQFDPTTYNRDDDDEQQVQKMSNNNNPSFNPESSSSFLFSPSFGDDNRININSDNYNNDGHQQQQGHAYLENDADDDEDGLHDAYDDDEVEEDEEFENDFNKTNNDDGSIYQRQTTNVFRSENDEDVSPQPQRNANNTPSPRMMNHYRPNKSTMSASPTKKRRTTSLGNTNQETVAADAADSNPKNSQRWKISFLFHKMSKFLQHRLNQHKRCVYPSSVSPNAAAYCRSITIWAVLRQLPFWYQAFSAFVVVAFILVFASRSSLIGVLLSALHVTFGMEALWPAAYQKHLASITLHERLAFAGYAVLLGVCAFAFVRFLFTYQKLTRDLPLMKQLVFPEEKSFVNSKLIYIVVFIPAIVEAAMAVRGNMEDVFIEMGERQRTLATELDQPSSSAFSSSHWSLQASAMLWTMEYWKQTIIIPALFNIAWRLISDVSNSQYCSQRWNLVCFCAWRNLIGFVVYPHRFFCWVGAGGFFWYLAVFGVVNYCSASNPMNQQNIHMSNGDTKNTNNNNNNNNPASSLAASPSASIRRNGRLSAVRFEGDSSRLREEDNNFTNTSSLPSTTSLMNKNNDKLGSPSLLVSPSTNAPSSNSFASYSNNNNSSNASTTDLINATTTPFETRRVIEFAHSESTREIILLTIAATLRSAAIVPFLCITVLTILAGVHVIELLGLWLGVFLFLTWSPAILRSFATDGMALLSFAVANVLIFWLEQLRIIDHDDPSYRSSSNNIGSIDNMKKSSTSSLEGYEKLKSIVTLTFTIFTAALAISSWMVILLALPFKKFRIVTWRYQNVPVLVWFLWILLAYGFFFGFNFIFEGQPQNIVADDSVLQGKGVQANNFNNTNFASPISRSASVITDEETRKVSRSLYAVLRPILLGYDNISTVLVNEYIPKQTLFGFRARSWTVWLFSEGGFLDSPSTASPSSSSPTTATHQTADLQEKLFSLRWLLTLFSSILFVSAIMVGKWLMRYNERIVVERRTLLNDISAARAEYQNYSAQLQLWKKQHQEEVEAAKKETNEKQGNEKVMPPTPPPPFNDRKHSSIHDKFFGPQGILTNFLTCDATIHLISFSNIIDRFAKTISLLLFLLFCYRVSNWFRDYVVSSSTASHPAGSTATTTKLTPSSATKSDSTTSSSPSSEVSSASSTTTTIATATTTSSVSFGALADASSYYFFSALDASSSSTDYYYHFSASVIRGIAQFLAFAFIFGAAVDVIEPISKIFAKCLGSKQEILASLQQQQQQNSNNNSLNFQRNGNLNNYNSSSSNNNNNMNLLSNRSNTSNATNFSTSVMAPSTANMSSVTSAASTTTNTNINSGGMKNLYHDNTSSDGFLFSHQHDDGGTVMAASTTDSMSNGLGVLLSNSSFGGVRGDSRSRKMEANSSTLGGGDGLGGFINATLTQSVPQRPLSAAGFL